MKTAFELRFDSMNTLLLIVLLLGTLCIIFQRKTVDFLFSHCRLGKLLDKLGTCFLSRREKERSRQEDLLRKASPEELQTEWHSILAKYAKKYKKPHTFPNHLEECLPDELTLFFKEYDYLSIDGANILDIKALKRITLGKSDYIIIGRDEQEESLFIIRADGRSAASSQVFMIDSNLDNAKNLIVNTDPANSYSSIRHFVCIMRLYLADRQYSN